MSEMNSGTILDILGSGTRRRILTVLSQEPMYFNQLAKEMGVGQQAVLRHLQTLEECGIIETYAEKSNLGAPDRKYYRLNASFILTISLSEDYFSITNQKIIESRQKHSRKYYARFDSMPQDTGKALSLLQENLINIEEEVSALESRLNDLQALRQLILQKLHEIGKDIFGEAERKILYKIIEASPKSIAELADILDERESNLKTIITGMRSKMNKQSAQLLFGDLN